MPLIDFPKKNLKILNNMTRTIFIILMSITVITLSSCSDSKIRISTSNNFEVVILPDGSWAYLNNESSIEYDKIFNERVVQTEGEVFFSVKKGKSPFVVKTELGEIQVLGTKFNVKSSYKELEVEVEEGIVELKIDKFIKKVKKGQKAFFKTSKKTVKIYKAEFKHSIWIKDLKSEFKKIGKEFNVSFKQIEKESKKIGRDFKRKLKNY